MRTHKHIKMRAQCAYTEQLKNNAFDLSCRKDEVAYVKYLANAMYTDPTIVACCRCVKNGCLANDISIAETGKSLTPQFAAAINQHMKKFAADAINMHYMCGFVVYYVEVKDSIRLPYTLPLGSFTWCTERLVNSKKVWPFGVKIRGIDCSFDERRLYVFGRDTYSRSVLYSPMEGIIQLLTNHVNMQNSICVSVSNQDKTNVLVSEKIDIKDQTLNGIQMLDDARQYMLKGSTPLQTYDLGVRLAGVRTDTVNFERELALLQSNKSQNSMLMTSIPPNSQVTTVPMQTPSMDILKESQNQYVLACCAYFGVDLVSSKTTSQNNASCTLRPSDDIRLLCEMLEDLLGQAYANCFDVQRDKVQVKLMRQKLEVQPDDVKTLWECGIFTSQELKKRFS